MLSFFRRDPSSDEVGEALKDEGVRWEIVDELLKRAQDSDLDFDKIDIVAYRLTYFVKTGELAGCVRVTEGRKEQRNDVE